MPEPFDPYLQWLGIRDPSRPPNHYRLLGVELFEGDTTVLANAADRQMAHVRTFQMGARAVDSQRLLNELAAAKVCLLTPEKKTAYDTALRAKLGLGERQITSRPPVPSPKPGGPPPLPSQRVGTRPPPGAAGSMPPAVPALPPVALGGLDVEIHPEPPAPPARGHPVRPAAAIAFLTGAALILGLLTLLAAIGRDFWRKPPAGPPDPDLGSLVGPGGSSSQGPAKGEAPNRPSHDGRLDVPPTDARVKALEGVLREFKDDYDRSNRPDAKRSLARKLLDKAQESKNDANLRYVLLTEAANQAVEAGESAVLVVALMTLGKEYAVDCLATGAALMEKAARQNRDGDTARSMAEAALILATEAVGRDSYDMATVLAQSAKGLADKAKDSSRAKQADTLIRELPERSRWYNDFVKAERSLESQRDDPAANLTAGKYYCAVRGDWSRGLPMLLKARDERLKTLIRAEMPPPNSPKEMVALGDRWWNAARPPDDKLLQRLVRARGVYWYHQALPLLSGRAREQPAKRIQEFGRK